MYLLMANTLNTSPSSVNTAMVIIPARAPQMAPRELNLGQMAPRPSRMAGGTSQQLAKANR